MKNFIRIKGELLANGMALMNVHTSEYYEPFQDYVDLLLENEGANTTTKQYAEHVSRFLDFLYEYRVVANEHGVVIDPKRLFNNYERYLTKGRDCNDEVLRQVAINLNKTDKTSLISISQGIESSLSGFMEMQLFDNDSQQEYLKSLAQTSQTNNLQRNKMRESSWREATTRTLGQAKPITKTKLFPRASKKAKRGSLNNGKEDALQKAFPAELSVDFFTQSIESISPRSNSSVVRDVLLYTLLASSGVRQSEALQVTIDDVDFEKKEINIVNPFTRVNTGLTEKEDEHLCWKGRVTPKTFLIQPFAHMFWHLLEIYLNSFYKTNVNHRFLFQKYNGRPFFAADRSERSKSFKMHLKNVNPNLTKYGLHSFRHFYGFYLYNYIPVVDADGNVLGQGFPLAYVKILMGHASIKSTEKYAREDVDLIQFAISASNVYVKNKGIAPKELLEQFYARQMQRLEDTLGAVNG